MRLASGITVIGLLALLLSFGGCASNKQGRLMPMPEAWYQLQDDSESGTVVDGVVDIFRNSSVPSDRWAKVQERKLADARSAMRGQPLNAYSRLVDQAAQKLIKDLPNSAALQNATHKQVLIIGDVVNEAGISDPQLETALRELSAKLQENESMRQKFVFVGMTTDAAKRATEAAGAKKPVEMEDPFADESTAGPAQYNPDTIYTLRGKFRRETGTAEYICEYTLIIEITKPSTRQTLSPCVVKEQFLYHPYLGRWITDAENEKLKLEHNAGKR